MAAARARDMPARVVRVVEMGVGVRAGGGGSGVGGVTVRLNVSLLFYIVEII